MNKFMYFNRIYRKLGGGIKVKADALTLVYILHELVGAEKRILE